MCGIIAYSGYRNCYPILLQGIKKLEYRGYDSSGIALMDQEKIHIYKKAGEVSELAKWIHQETVSHASIGIGHTRWATHGMPNDLNAHPHISNSKKIAIVHNGIIENNNTLKKKLVNKGYTFKSETDTEILVNFIADIKQCNNCSIEEAVRIALSKVIGAYAIVILDVDTPNTLIAAKKSSPMVVGIGKGELLLASDVVPLLSYTNEVVFLEDNNIIHIHHHTFSIKNLKKNILQTPYIQKLHIELEEIEKGDFEHFLLKEIYEQPTSIRNCLRGRLHLPDKNLILGGINDEYMHALVKASKITIVACGTSWHAALTAEYLIEILCKIPVEVEYASEFRYRIPVIYKGDIVIAISQSGETADTLAAIELAKSLGATTISIYNVVESSLARMAHTGIYTHAGPEIGVASTKAFTAQLTALTILALKIAYQRKSITEELLQTLLLELDILPDKITKILLQSTLIQKIAKQFQNATNFLYLGRGYQFPIALEGALKLKELSYIHAEGYPAAEMKHGPLALIDENIPVIFISIQDRSYKKIISNIEEVKARKGNIIAIITEGDTFMQQLAHHIMEVPNAHELVMPVLTIIPLQLFAYHMALLRNCNVDKSRNLAKSVTVE